MSELPDPEQKLQEYRQARDRELPADRRLLPVHEQKLLTQARVLYGRHPRDRVPWPFWRAFVKGVSVALPIVFLGWLSWLCLQTTVPQTGDRAGETLVAQKLPPPPPAAAPKPFSTDEERSRSAATASSPSESAARQLAEGAGKSAPATEPLAKKEAAQASANEPAANKKDLDGNLEASEQGRAKVAQDKAGEKTESLAAAKPAAPAAENANRLEAKGEMQSQTQTQTQTDVLAKPASQPAPGWYRVTSPPPAWSALSAFDLRQENGAWVLVDSQGRRYTQQVAADRLKAPANGDVGAVTDFAEPLAIVLQGAGADAAQIVVRRAVASVADAKNQAPAHFNSNERESQRETRMRKQRSDDDGARRFSEPVPAQHLQLEVMRGGERANLEASKVQDTAAPAVPPARTGAGKSQP